MQLLVFREILLNIRGLRNHLKNQPQSGLSGAQTGINPALTMAIPKSFFFFREIFLLLVCELFRVHEMRSQLEVTEMLECKPYCAAPSFQRNTAAQKLWSVCMEMGHESV